MRLSRRRVIEGIALLAVLATIGAGCGGSDGSGDSADGTATTADLPVEPGGQLRYGIEGETASYDPVNGQWSASSWTVASAIFDPLMYYSADMELVPFLAESVTPNDDNTVWTITTREGVTFHNGEPFDAEAVRANFEAAKASPLIGAVMGPIIDMEVTGERTIEVTMAAPWVHFPHLLVGQPGMMMAPEMIADPDRGLHPIGTGPFALDEWEQDNYLRVVKYDDYWLAEPNLNEIEFQVIPDAAQRRLALESGDIDTAIVTASPDAATDPPEGTTLYRSELGEDKEVFLLLNQLHEPFDDIRVRRALIMATDRQQITEVVSGGLYEVADGIFDPSSPWYVETEYPAYDQDAAAELVAEIEAERGPLEITISGPTWPIVIAGGQLLQQQWEAAGIDVRIETLELAQYTASMVSGAYDVGLMQWHGAPHPDSEFVHLHSQYAAPEGELGLNFARNVDFEIDDALLEARATEDPDQLHELYGTVQERLAADLPYVFLWHTRDAILVSANVHDFGTWSLPDGEAGADLFQARHRYHQMWLDQ